MEKRIRFVYQVNFFLQQLFPKAHQIERHGIKYIKELIHFSKLKSGNFSG